jgi:peptide/nickel transport system substrate-binding protein
MTFLMRAVLIALTASCLIAAEKAELRLCLRHDPKTFDPLLVNESSSETIRYLTGGVLIRTHRRTQKPEPGIASSWKLSEAGRRITFDLRAGLKFSDGTLFSAEDVAYTLNRMMDPALKSPLKEAFGAGTSNLQVTVISPSKVSILLPAPIAGVERLFDQIAIMSSRSPLKAGAVLGPFLVEQYQPGRSVVLARNPHYWKRDAQGRQLPALDRIRFDIQANREIENVRFGRGEIHMIAELDADTFERLRSEGVPGTVDAGGTDESEFLWFNQVKRAPIPGHKLAWFRSTAFRKAISHAVNRADIVRLVYRGHAEPAAGPFSRTNKLWFNSKLTPDAFSPKQSLALLASDGFQLKGNTLYDRGGRAVEFSLITNAGNKARARVAALLQQDLAKIGINVTVAPLEFGSLIDRITRSYAYDACLLGLVNVDPDPNGQMNVWLSSGGSHQWNPGQAAPETPWEAEIDKLMRAQSSTLDQKKRRASFDRVQEIIAAQAPFVYLITKNALVAVHSSVGNVAVSPFRPQLLWNAENLTLGRALTANR